VPAGRKEIPRGTYRSILRQSGLDGSAFGRRAPGRSPSYISAVEAGRRNLTLGQLANIANAMQLGIDISFSRPDGTPVRTD
jgi:transcriptional regulator with XRE-family HTH domain